MFPTIRQTSESMPSIGLSVLGAVDSCVKLGYQMEKVELQLAAESNTRRRQRS